jgi:hypothetical protein
MTGDAGNHPRHEDFPWTIAVVDHPERDETPGYRRSRALMRRLVATLDDWTYAPGPYQDHHGGGLWVQDAEGWLCLQTSLGIEWSAQFCADPTKVDHARRQVVRVFAAFPGTVEGYETLGYHDGARLLGAVITTAAQVSEWTDSIFNASVPLPVGAHTGVLPRNAGYHHYPKPIVDIDHFRYDDFQLFVKDPDGLPAVVVPVSPRGAGDGRVRLLAANPSSVYVDRLQAKRRADPRSGLRVSRPIGFEEGPDVLDAADPLAIQAFRRQS